MRLIDVLGPSCIVPALRAVRKDDVIKELSAHLVAQVAGVHEADIARVLLDREKLGSTAVGEGVAVPHAKLKLPGGIVACLGRSRRGVDFDAPDGEPVHFLFAVLSPTDSAGAHLKFLARFSQLFRDEAFRKQLLNPETAGDMYQIIADRDGR